MILYGRRQSRAARCLWVLEEMELPYRQVTIDAQQGDNHTPQFLALNPSGKVPVLDDDGFVLRESLAINYYLVAKAQTPLWPEDICLQAQIHQWTSWAVTELEAPLTTIVRDRRRVAATGSEPNATLIDDCTALAKTALTLLEGHLLSNDYVASDTFTLGDINACSTVMLAPMFLDLSLYPATQRWAAACAARTAWQHVGGMV